MKEIILNLLLVLGGATGQYIISTLRMPKKDERQADQEFIETLIERVSYLEGKIDTLTSQLNEVMRENERLKVELQHLKR